MEVPIIVVILGLLIFGAHFFNAIFSRTKIPNALWFLIIGIIVGPVLGLVKLEHFGAVGPVFTSVTLIIVLFESGVNLKLREVGSAIGSASLMTLINFLLSATIATTAAMLFTPIDNLITASFFGVIIAGTSSAVVIPIIKQLKMNPKGSTILLLESALSDVLCLVIGLALLSAMKKGVFEFSEMLSLIWRSFLIAALIGFGAGIVWSLLLEYVRKLQNNAFTNLAFVFIVAGLTDMIGLNGGIATLIFGITVGNAYLFEKTILRRVIPCKELLPTEKTFFAEIAFILQTYFFVYVGASMAFGNPMMIFLGLIIVVAIVAIRPLTVRLLVRDKMDFKDLATMGVLSPKGLVPAILASIPLQMGLAHGDHIQDLAYSVVLFSIVLCSVLVILLNKDPFAISYLRNVLGGKAIDQGEDDLRAPSTDTPNASESDSISNPADPDH